MTPPTKFQKMRANRDAYEWRKRDMTPYREAVKAGVTAERLLAAPLTPPAFFARQNMTREQFAEQYEQRPAVPTMEIDGVLYKEAPDNGQDTDACVGCAFQNTPGTYQCLEVEKAAIKVFGDECSTRRTIYIRVD